MMLAAAAVVPLLLLLTSEVAGVFGFQVKWATGRTGLRRIKTTFLIKSTKKEWPTVKELSYLNDNLVFPPCSSHFNNVAKMRSAYPHKRKRQAVAFL